VFFIAPCLFTDPDLLSGPVKLAQFSDPSYKTFSLTLAKENFSFYERSVPCGAGHEYSVHQIWCDFDRASSL